MGIALTAAQVAVVNPEDAEIHSVVLGVAVTQGQALRIDSSGLGTLSDASATATAPFYGIALEKGGAGQAVSILKRGLLAGFTLSGLDYGAKVYIDNGAGSLGTAAGDVSNVAGVVFPQTDKDKTKLLYVDADWSAV